ncbi:MAG: hypothetical protein Q9171_002725 [Xanthocarpia ochracea]
MDRKADPETQLMVDEAILDYLIYTAIKSLLKLLDRGSREEHNVHLPVQMVDAFLAVFRALHNNYNASGEIKFRLQLLQFTYVFVQHYHPITATRELSTRQTFNAGDLKVPQSRSPHQEQPHTIPLERTLPMFLALSAAQNELQGSTITEIWMMLAAGYMAQSYMEQVIVYQNQRPDLLEDAFHWGYDADCRSEEASDQWHISNMFDTDENLTHLWESIKEEHIEALRPPDKTSLEDHLEVMANGALSVVAFKDKVSEFLTGLLSAHAAPLLIQLEMGKVDGLSRKATAALKTRAGFIYETPDNI